MGGEQEPARRLLKDKSNEDDSQQKGCKRWQSQLGGQAKENERVTTWAPPIRAPTETGSLTQKTGRDRREDIKIGKLVSIAWRGWEKGLFVTILKSHSEGPHDYIYTRRGSG